MNFDLATVTPSATQRILRIRVQGRCAHEGADIGHYEQVSATLKDPTSARLVCSPRDFFKQYNPPNIKKFSGAQRTANPDGKEWTKAMVDSLQAEFYGYLSSGNNAQFLRVYEVYAEVDIRDQAVTSAVTVTGNTTSSRPSVAFTFTPNGDGDAQVAYRTKVFTAAQYGATGFDPETSPSAWDSGEVASSATSLVVGADLVNGVTYKAYVKAAADFNGARWYSAWALSSAFTEGFEPLPQPTLAVTSDSTVPHLRNLLTIDSKLNLLSANDASFETGVGGWTAVLNCAVVASATFALKGAQSLRLTATAGGDMAAGTPGGVFAYPIGPSRPYTILGHFRAGTTGRSCRMESAEYDAGGTQIGGTFTGSNVTDTNAGFTQAILTRTSAPGVAYVLVQARVLAAGAAEIHYLDAVSLSTSASTTWFTGGVASIDRQLVEFTDLTPSHGPIANLLNPQLASGGEATSNADGFYTRSAKDLLTFDRSQQVDGDGSLRWDVGSNTGSLLDVGTALGAFDPTYTAPAVPGTAYTLSIWVRADAGTHSLRLVANSIDQTGAIVGTSTNGATNATIAQAWQRLTVTHTAQAGAVALRPSVENVNGDLVAYFLDALQLEEGTAATVWQQGHGQVPAWQPVRGALTALAADARTNLAVIFDREAPPGVIRLYRATNQVSYADGTVGVGPVSLWVPSKLAIPSSGTDRYCILKDPQQPAHDLSVSLASLSERIAEDLSEFHPIRPNAPQGFGQRPLVVSDWVGGDDGMMELRITDEADWLRLKQMLRTKRALLLQPPEGGQRYIRCKDRSWPRTRISTSTGSSPSLFMRLVQVDFVEVDRPVVLA